MRKLIPALGILALALVMAAPASANSICASGSTCTVLLTQTNTLQLNGVVITVTIDNTGANTVLSFQLTTNPLTNTPLGIDQVGWNGVVTTIGHPPVSTSPSTSSASTFFGGHQAVVANGNMDGFGSFNIQGADPAGTGGISGATVITFTLNGLITTFSANSGGNEFSAHVRFAANPGFSSCSGFVGGQNGTGATQDDAPGCSPLPPPNNPVPEPSSLALLGTGLVGVAGFIRRRLIA